MVTSSITTELKKKSIYWLFLVKNCCTLGVFLSATSRHTKGKHVKLFSRERTVLLKTGETNSITKNGRKKNIDLSAQISGNVNTLYIFPMSGMKLFLKLYNLTQWITAQNPLRCIVFSCILCLSYTIKYHESTSCNDIKFIDLSGDYLIILLF